MDCQILSYAKICIKENINKTNIYIGIGEKIELIADG
jgi:hypothetical protein